MLKEILWHGRGGQGVVVASSILGTAFALFEGKYALSIPSFGSERRGAALIAITRYSDIPIRHRDLSPDPDYVVILDDSLADDAIDQLSGKKDHYVILNSKKRLVIKNSQIHVSYVDADAIAMSIFKRLVVNTVMLGAFAATGGIKLESINKSIESVLAPAIYRKNVEAAEAGFKSLVSK